MRESILEGMATDVKDLSSEPGWWAGRFWSPARPRRMPANWPLRGSSRCCGCGVMTTAQGLAGGDGPWWQRLCGERSGRSALW